MQNLKSNILSLYLKTENVPTACCNPLRLGTSHNDIFDNFCEYSKSVTVNKQCSSDSHGSDIYKKG